MDIEICSPAGVSDLIVADSLILFDGRLQRVQGDTEYHRRAELGFHRRLAATLRLGTIPAFSGGNGSGCGVDGSSGLTRSLGAHD